jgi:broad specificity phosphatase PhoE
MSTVGHSSRQTLSLKPKDVVLVRHGETAWSKSGQHTGATDIPLTPAGEAAAKRLSPVLKSLPFARVLASPLQRARHTRELAGFSDRMELDADLMEWNYGSYEGLTSPEIVAGAPDWLVFRDGCPQGERHHQVAARVDRVIARLRGGEGPVLVFAHGHLLRVLVARWLGLPPLAGKATFFSILPRSTCSRLQGHPGPGLLECAFLGLKGHQKGRADALPEWF